MGPQGTIVSLNAPQVLVLLRRTNPNPHVYVGHGVERFINNRTPGGLDAFLHELGEYESSVVILEGTVTRVANDRGVPRAQVALAWLLQRETVAAPIVGAARPGHIEDAVASVELTLSEKEIEELEQPYTARPIVGH